MTETILKRRGGRPPLPLPPQNSADVRRLIAAEVVKANPSERRLRVLYRLLKTFVAADDVARTDAQNRIEAQQIRLNEEELELRRAEYRRRYFSAGLGLQENERLKRRVAELEEQLRTVTARGIDAGIFDATGLSCEQRVPITGQNDEPIDEPENEELTDASEAGVDA